MENKNDPPVFCRTLAAISAKMKQITGASLCVYQYTQSLPVVIGVADCVHYCPLCRHMLKSNPSREYCIYFHKNKVYKKALDAEGPFLIQCRAGIQEAVIPIRINKELAAVMFLGQCRDAGSFTDVFASDAASKELYEQLPFIPSELLLSAAQLGDIAIKAVIGNLEALDYTGNDTVTGPHAYILKATNIINNNLPASQLTPSYVANKMNISKEYLSRLFKACFKMTLAGYINYARMERAKLMLLNSGGTVQQVAEKCGYSDQNYFSRVFKKCTTVSPGEYRKIHGTEMLWQNRKKKIYNE